MSRFVSRLLPVCLATGLMACDADRTRAPATERVAAPQSHGDSLDGARLAAVLGCGACHPGAPAPGDARLHAPPLDALAERWDPASLAGYLRDPVPLHGGRVARMPDFHLDDAEAGAVARHLLGAEDAARGADIVDALNCAGCHTGIRPAAGAPGPPLAGVAGRLRRGWLRAYLERPEAVRPFGYRPGSGSRMPDFRLSAGEADRLAEWLMGDAAPASSAASSAEPPPALSPFQARKAEALVRDHLACLGCHALDGEGGRIGPALDGAAARLEPAYLRSVVTDPGRAVPGGTTMPRPLEDSATLDLVVRYLQQPRGDPRPVRYLSLVENRPTPPDAGGGARSLYSSHCAGCHGVAGDGAGFNAPHLPARPTAHADSGHMATRPDATLFDGIHAGGHILGRSHRMPAFGATLSPSEIHGLVAHLRELCACPQPGWASP